MFTPRCSSSSLQLEGAEVVSPEPDRPEEEHDGALLHALDDDVGRWRMRSW